MTYQNTTTAADRAAKVIYYALSHSVDISPADEAEWTRFCCALKVLGYDCNTFVALSNCPQRDAVAKWQAQKTPAKYVHGEDAAAATILHFAADAGIRAKDLCSPDTWTTNRPTRPKAPTPTPKPEKLVTMPLDVVATMAERVTDTALARYLCSLFDPAAVKRTLAAYMVGGTEPPYHNDAENVGLWTSYPLISAAGVVVDCKLMGYRADGHRAKRADGSGLLGWWLRCTKQLGDGCTRAPWVCFGDHLAASVDPADPVNVVESEKTAIMAVLYFGGYWVAVGSLGFLTADRLAAHKRRKMIVYPDIDGAKQWTAKAKTLREAGFNVVMDKWCYDMATKLTAAGLIPQKSDLGDVIDYLAANRIYLDDTAAPAPAAHTAAVDDTDTAAENTEQNAENTDQNTAAV